MTTPTNVTTYQYHPEEIKEEFENSAEETVNFFNFLSANMGGWFTGIQHFDKTSFPTDCMLIVTEVAEAVEADRHDTDVLRVKSRHVPEISAVAEELADILVRVLHVADKYGILIGQAFVAKMRYNFTRPIRHNKEY